MAAFMFNRAKCVAMKSASVFQCLKLLKNSFVAPRAQGTEPAESWQCGAYSSGRGGQEVRATTFAT